MALSDSQKKMYLTQIDQCRKRIINIQTKAAKDVAYEEKKILDIERKLRS